MIPSTACEHCSRSHPTRLLWSTVYAAVLRGRLPLSSGSCRDTRKEAKGSECKCMFTIGTVFPFGVFKKVPVCPVWIEECSCACVVMHGSVAGSFSRVLLAAHPRRDPPPLGAHTICRPATSPVSNAFSHADACDCIKRVAVRPYARRRRRGCGSCHCHRGRPRSRRFWWG